MDQNFLEGFKHYLTDIARTKSTSPLSANNQHAYFNKLRAALNQAEQQGIIHDNPVRRVKNIKPENNQRVYLTEEELRALAKAECRYDVLKSAFLFSACTGLRWSDVNKLVWADVELFYDGYRLIFRQKKLNLLAQYGTHTLGDQRWHHKTHHFPRRAPHLCSDTTFQGCGYLQFVSAAWPLGTAHYGDICGHHRAPAVDDKDNLTNSSFFV